MIIYYKQKSLEMPLNKEKPCISARFPLVRIMGLEPLSNASKTPYLKVVLNFVGHFVRL